MIPLIDTSRLTLRPMAATDLEHYLAFRAHPDVLRHLHEEAMTSEKAAAFLARQSGDLPGEEGGYFALAIDHRQDGRMIGEIGMYLQPTPQCSGDIGWIIHPDWQGHGYATEAATALIGFGFQTLGLHRITAGCDAPNRASLRIMEKLGMRREAHFRQNRNLAGTWHDAFAYALLREEWREMTRQNPL